MLSDADANVAFKQDTGPIGQSLVGEVFDGQFRVDSILQRYEHALSGVGSEIKTGERVLVRMIASHLVRPGARMRLDHETRLMQQINSQMCSGFTQWGEEGGWLYLVRPFGDGVTLRERLAGEPLTVEETLALGQCLVAALHEAHRRGVLHLNVRPSNVVVAEEPTITRATLVDFGIASIQQSEPSVGQSTVNAVRYMSPEHAGLVDQDIRETADLYAVGAVLFECLAGRSVFQASTVGELLREHMTAPAPKLRELGLSVPRSVDEVIQRLLCQDPRDRYQSAEAVRADLETIASGLRKGLEEPPCVIGRHDRRGTLTEPAFVGRHQELNGLLDQLKRARGGRNGLVFLEAESGGGKSRLLQECAQQPARDGAWIMQGQGRDQAAQRPFEMLSGLADGLVADCGLDPELASTMRQALGEQVESVCASLPELAPGLGATHVEVGPESFAEARSVQALSTLLDAIGATARPAVLLLDDCQWADELTLKVLSYWLRSLNPSGQSRQQSGVMIVVVFRSEEVAADHQLRMLNPTLHLTLPEFDADDLRQLVESMAGAIPDEAAELITRLAAGSPFMAAASLRGLVETGALAAGTRGWLVDADELSNVQSSRHAAAFLARRVELLPEASLRLLSVGAVLGKEFDLLQAATLAGQESEEAIAAVDEARHRHIVWARMPDSRCVFMHDKLRETLLDRLPTDRRRELHLQAAEGLERDTPDEVFELAWHFDAAGESTRALPYALLAADQARTTC